VEISGNHPHVWLEFWSPVTRLSANFLVLHTQTPKRSAPRGIAAPPAWTSFYRARGTFSCPQEPSWV
jgi:hypothetical protein